MNGDVEQIKERLDIAAVVGEYVQLKPAGKNLKALCPFHQEKTPSFIVSPHRGTWHCFGCAEGGDIFSFIQKIEGVDFPAALKTLAEKAGVTLSKQNPETRSRRQRLLDALAAASRFYHHVLTKDKAGKKALEYLQKRGVKAPTIKEFQIGYAPQTWDAVQKWLSAQGFMTEEMIAAGIVGRSERGKTFDRFRGRIMFPIHDTQGRVVAFGGRIVPWHETGNEGKYVNSPETALYEKRRVVYNLHRAKHILRQSQPCIVVEGYMDVVMLVQAGVKNVVATSGTAFTLDHIEQLKRFTKTLHFAFDADAAGWKATVAATQAALGSGMNVATVVLPAGKDPADLVLEEPDKVVEVTSATRPLMSVLIEQLQETPDIDTQEKQLEALLPLIRHVRNPIQQGQMVQQVAYALHVPEAHILDLLRQAEAPAPAFISPTPVISTPSKRNAEVEVEHYILGLTLVHSEVRQEVFPRLESTFFLDSSSQALYNSMHRLAEREPRFFSLSTDEIIGSLDGPLVSFAEGVRAQVEDFLQTSTNSPVQEGQTFLRVLQRTSIKSRLSALQQQLAQAEGQKRTEALQQFQALAEQLVHIDS